jgi:hypothetical protein
MEAILSSQTPFHKKGHVEYKTGFCTECGDSFEYPKHFKPKPVHCAAHDPNPVEAIDLSQFEQAAGEFPEIVELDGARYHVDASDRSFYDLPHNGISHLDTGNYSQVVTGGYTNPASTTYTGPGQTHTFTHLPGGSAYDFRITAGGGTDATPESAQRSAINAYPKVEIIGNRFADSAKMRSIEQIRDEYEHRLAAVQMPTITDIILPRPRRGKTVTIIHLGDIHIGTDACVYSALKEMLDYILATPDTYLALQGDMVDLLTAHSVGVMAEQALTIQDQFNIATADFLPLAKARKILWMLKGNHEDRLDRATKNIVDGAQWMARILDVNYLQTEGYTRVICGDAKYLSYNIPGFNAGASAGARRNKMDGMLGRFPSADILTCGHNHHLDAIQRIEDVILPNNHRAHRQRWGIYTGTYHSYIGYPAEFGLGAGPLGCVAVHFDVEYGSIKPEILPVLPINGVYRHVLPEAR